MAHLQITTIDGEETLLKEAASKHSGQAFGANSSRPTAPCFARPGASPSALFRRLRMLFPLSLATALAEQQANRANGLLKSVMNSDRTVSPRS